MSGDSYSTLIRIVPVVLASLLLAMVGPARGETGQRPPDLTYLSSEAVTPHIAWARPYARGTTKVLALASGAYQMRELVELRQRFDFDISSSLYLAGDATSLLWTVGDHRLNKTQVADRYNALLTGDQRYDAILMSGNVWDYLSAQARKNLIRQVQGGTGLVWINPCPSFPEPWEFLPVSERLKPKWVKLDEVAEHEFLDAVPLALMPKVSLYAYEMKQDLEMLQEFEGGELPSLILTGEHGEGRIAILTCSAQMRVASGHGFAYLNGILPAPLAPNPAVPEFPYWEHLYGLVGRAVLWAAQREPSVRFGRAKCPRALTPEDSEGKAIRLKLKSDLTGEFELWCRIQDGQGATVREQTQRVQVREGDGGLEFRLPRLLPGLNVANFILSDQKGKLDWCAVPIAVEGSTRLGEIKLTRRAYESSLPVSGEIKVSSGAGLTGLVLELSLLDGYGRELAVEKRDVKGAAVKFRMPLVRALSMRGLIHATLFRHGQPLDRAHARFIITPLRKWDDFETVIWGHGPGNCAEHLYAPRMAQFRRMGITTMVINANDTKPGYLDAVLDHDLKFCTRISGHGPGGIKLPSSSDALRETVPAAAMRWAVYGPMLNMAGDESYSTPHEKGEDEMRPSALAQYRAWLKKQYGDLAALNAEWGRDYWSWEEIIEDRLADLRGKTSNFAPWSDLQTFVEHCFAYRYKSIQAGIVKGDPSALNSASGTQTPFRTGKAHDWWRLLNYGGFRALMGYTRGDQFRMQLSFAKIPQVLWSGYGKAGQRLTDSILGHMWTGTRGVGLFNGPMFLNPDLSWNGASRGLRDAIPLTCHGMGKLLIHSEYVFDPVAVHYSQRSIHASTALGRAGDMARAVEGIGHRLMKGAGIETKYLSYEQIERGELSVDRFRLILMAHSLAVSPKEAAAVRKFVAEGGIVLADMLPAIMDAHCRTLPGGQLDDVFGVKRVVPDGPAVHKIEATPEGQVVLRKVAGKVPDIRIPAGLPVSAVDAGVSAEDAIALASEKDTRVPMFLVHRFGKGWAILVNGDALSLCVNPPKDTDPEKRLALRERGSGIVADILRAAGLVPDVLLLGSEGRPVATQMQRLYREGENLYTKPFGLPDDRGPLALKLRRQAHVYEMSTGKYVGSVDRFQVPTPGTSSAMSYALLSYKPERLAIAAAETCERGTDFEVELQIKADATPSMHVIRMEVFEPGGKSVDHYAQNVLCRDGKARPRIPFALNDTPGQWVLRLRDVATGLRAEHTLRLK